MLLRLFLYLFNFSGKVGLRAHAFGFFESPLKSGGGLKSTFLGYTKKGQVGLLLFGHSITEGCNPFVVHKIIEVGIGSLVEGKFLLEQCPNGLPGFAG